MQKNVGIYLAILLILCFICIILDDEIKYFSVDYNFDIPTNSSISNHDYNYDSTILKWTYKFKLTSIQES